MKMNKKQLEQENKILKRWLAVFEILLFIFFIFSIINYRQVSRNLESVEDLVENYECVRNEQMEDIMAVFYYCSDEFYEAQEWWASDPWGIEE